MTVGCSFITCAVKKKGVEFCWECEENRSCEKWRRHRDAGKHFDSFKCYQKLEANIASIRKRGLNEFEKIQRLREKLLTEMLHAFNEGRSKSYYCIAATVLEPEELAKVLHRAKKESVGLEIKEKSKVLHSLIDEVARRKNYVLKLRKYKKP